MLRISTFLLVVALCPISSNAQNNAAPKDTTWKTMYRSSSEKINDLVHTRLEVNFDFDKAYMYGKEWLTLKPHFYPTDSVSLDAKGMDIKKVSLMNGTTMTALKYEYDNQMLRIKLGKTFKNNEKYTLYFEYTSKPDELEEIGRAHV